MDSLYDCLESPTKYGYEVEYFWISGVALVSVGFLGLIGNILSLIVLCQKTFRRRVFYNLLIELTCFDILFILSYGIHVGYQSMACQDIYNLNVSHITYQLLNLFLSGSVYSTVVISIERYIGMCHPYLKYGRSTWIYVLAVIFVSVLYNFPRFFEYQYTVVNGTIVSSITTWADSESYKDRYHDLCEIIVENMIPLVLLFLTNGAIIRKMYWSPKNQVTDVKSKTRKNRATTTKTLLVIVAVFMISHIPCIAFKTLYYFGCSGCNEEEETEYRRYWYFIYPIKRLSLMTNSSVNVIIYCIVGTKYRNELLCLFGCKIPAPMNKENHSATTTLGRALKYSMKLLRGI